jgi:hypothetical protein
MKTVIVINPYKFKSQRGTIATALKEIDPNNAKSLLLFLTRLVDLGVLVRFRIS